MVTEEWEGLERITLIATGINIVLNHLPIVTSHLLKQEPTEMPREDLNVSPNLCLMRKVRHVENHLIHVQQFGGTPRFGDIVDVTIHDLIPKLQSHVTTPNINKDVQQSA